MSLSSSSETNGDENLSESVLKRELSAGSFSHNGVTEDTVQGEQSVIMEANGENGVNGYPDDHHGSEGNTSPVSPKGVGDGIIEDPETAKTTDAGNHGNQSFDRQLADDDDIQLGEEAISMTRTGDSDGKSPGNHSIAGQSALAKLLIPQDSFHSDMTQNSQSTVSSVEALLEDRKVDPEVVLTNLGFGSLTDDENYCRIPLRFLQQTSGAKGINVDHFLEEHEDLSHLLNAWQQQQYGMVQFNPWQFAKTVSDAQSFINVVHANVEQKGPLSPPNVPIPFSVLHPANQHALASQGYYDDQDGGKSSERAKHKRKSENHISADDKRRLFKKSHRSWNLVDDESDSESPQISESTGGVTSSGSRVTMSLDSSDGSLSPFWNAGGRKDVDSLTLSQSLELSQNKVLTYLFPEKSKPEGNCFHGDTESETWYTPPSSPPPGSPKDVWSSSTLLDVSLCTSVGDDSVFEEVLSGIEVKEHENKVDGLSNENEGGSGTSFVSHSEPCSEIRSIISTSKEQNPSLSKKKSVSFKDEEDIVSEISGPCDNAGVPDKTGAETVILANISNNKARGKPDFDSKLEQGQRENLEMPENTCSLDFERMLGNNVIENEGKVEGVPNAKMKLTDNTQITKVTTPKADENPEDFEKRDVFQVNVETVPKQFEISWQGLSEHAQNTVYSDMTKEQSCDNVRYSPKRKKLVRQKLTVSDVELNSYVSELRSSESSSVFEDSGEQMSTELGLPAGCFIFQEQAASTSETESVPVFASEESEEVKLSSEPIVCKTQSVKESVLSTVSSQALLHHDIPDCDTGRPADTQPSQTENSNNNCSVVIGQDRFKSVQWQKPRDQVYESCHLTGQEDANGFPVNQSGDRLQNVPDLVNLGRNSGVSDVSLSDSHPSAVLSSTSAPDMVCGHSMEGLSFNDDGRSWQSPVHPPERRRLRFLSGQESPAQHEVLASDLMSPDILLQLTSDLEKENQSVSTNPLARTSSAQSDSSGFADTEPDNMLDLAMSKVNSLMGSSCESDVTWASSVNTVLPHSSDEQSDLIGQRSDHMTTSSDDQMSPPSFSSSSSFTEDKCIGTDIQGLDLIFQVLTPSGEVYHPAQGETTVDNQSSDAVLEGMSSQWNNDIVSGFSEKSCRFHESSYCIIPTMYESDFGIGSESWSAASNRSNDLNGNPTPQKNIVSRYYIDISPRKQRLTSESDADEKSEVSQLSLKLKNGRFRSSDSCGSSDSSTTTQLHTSKRKVQSLREELSDVEMRQEERDSRDFQDEVDEDYPVEDCNKSISEDRSLVEEADYSLCNFSHVHETCEQSPVGMSTPKTGPRPEARALHVPFCRRDMAVLNLCAHQSPNGQFTCSQLQAASTPEVKRQRSEEVEAAIFEYQKLASLINQPITRKRPGLGPVTTPRYQGPTHSDKWRALRQDQKLSEETRLMQQAIDRYKMELRHLESSFNAHYSKVYDMMTEEERDEIEELQLLRAEVYKEVCETEKLMLSRSAHLAGKRPDTLRPLASLDVVHQMIELLKEQMYQRTVVHDLDSSMDQILDSSSSSLPLSPWEEEVSDLKDELRREQREQQRELEKSFEDLKISLLEEVRTELKSGTQSLYQELQSKDQKINALQTEIRHLRRRSLQAELLPPR
ncbi:uncharacterized protein LOC135464444 [Liolophura sinensis]|uniref:uncharacterized protein LOC135464444 n=1 Tax=Liolophura sinensis TaxID=3198878 RepID=UPI00315925F4